jgi:hypothetical protein
MRFLRGRARRALRSLDLGDYDAMLTWSQWHSVHLLGLDVKRLRPDLRWVAHFSDPWVGNPLVQLDGLAHRLAVRMEAEVVATADVLEFTTEETARHTVSRYADDVAAKVRVVSHPFDPELKPAPAATSEPGRPEVVARYLGTFYGKRTPAPLFDALAQVGAQPGGLDGLGVELVGAMDKRLLATAAARRLPAGLVRHRPQVDYLTSLRLMREADLLLLVDAPAAENLYLASKLIDYVGSGRPIVAVTPPGRAASIVAALGGDVADPSEPDAVAAALAAGLDAARRYPPGTPWGDDTVRAEFTVGAVSRSRWPSLFGEPDNDVN